VTSIYEAAEHYQAEGTPLVVLAGGVRLRLVA
jgi:aconitase A